MPMQRSRQRGCEHFSLSEACQRALKDAIPDVESKQLGRSIEIKPLEPSMSRHGLTKIALGLALASSVAYNGLWIASSDELIDLRCISEAGKVRGAAMSAAERGNWLQAAHLYGYLSEFDPYSTHGCVFERSFSMVNRWAIPLWAIAYDRPYKSDDLDSLAKTGRALSLAKYHEAAQRAGLADPKRASRHPAKHYPMEIDASSSLPLLR